MYRNNKAPAGRDRSYQVKKEYAQSLFLTRISVFFPAEHLNRNFKYQAKSFIIKQGQTEIIKQGQTEIIKQGQTESTGIGTGGKKSDKG
ncbi:MAG: hypothetical protein D3908_02050 [Candidatus Electrothrix sp. AUS4]|nr:hypothetical protein [Candidatus Electrothrix sp. AUS4]